MLDRSVDLNDLRIPPANRLEQLSGTRKGQHSIEEYPETQYCFVESVQHTGDSKETGASYTVKAYQSSKRVDPDSGWQHESITLEAINPDYDDITIPPEEPEGFWVVAFFVKVLTAEA